MKLRVPRSDIRVPGYRFAGVPSGLKEGGQRDVALIVSEVPAVAAGAFTANRVKAAPVVLAARRVRTGRAQAIVVNSGNANAFTGTVGKRAAREMCRVAARALRIPEAWVLPCSTGRIGVPLPLRRVCAGIRAACRALSADGFADALEGMMTTDAFPKFAVERLPLDGREVTVAGMAKGAGMIAPQLRIASAAHATLLAFVLTDAAVRREVLQHALTAGLPVSFNAIVVDGDTSTNDTVLLLANGVAANRPVALRSAESERFCAAVGAVMVQLARLVVKDGEGATKTVDITVRGARTAADAERAAEAIARSPLCKAAFHGGDPYMGRIVCALGYSGAAFAPERLEIYLDGLCVVRGGRENPGRDRAQSREDCPPPGVLAYGRPARGIVQRAAACF